MAPYLNSTAAVWCGHNLDTDSWMEHQWQTSMKFRLELPEFATYQVGETHSYSGNYSGIMDIEGMYFAVAGCTPHITTHASSMRIQGTFDYTKNTRNNQMPLPTWAYSQFLGAPVEPYPSEIAVQLASVIAAGSKALMLYDIDYSYAGTEWLELTMMTLKSIQLLREEFRVGDIDGASFTKGDNPSDSTVSIIRSLNKLIIVAINTKADYYNDVLCSSGTKDHWNFHDHTIGNLKITLPADMTTANVLMEVTEQGEVIPVGVRASFRNGVALLQGIALGSSKTVVRFFVISD